MTRETTRRVALLVAGVLVLTAVLVADAVIGPSAPAPAVPPPPSAVVADAAASSSAWYCAGLAAASGAVLVTNPGRVPVTGTVRSQAAGSTAVVTKDFAAPPGQQVAVDLPQGAATVSFGGGGVGVLEAAVGNAGVTASPCASTTSDTWYFAHGSTAQGVGMAVAVFNPLPTPAVVDISFASPSGGTIVPPAYQGIPLAPGQSVVENVMDHVPNAASLATQVIALSGSVVATVFEQSPGPGHGGASFLDGATAPRSTWAFAQNEDVAGGMNSFVVYNPTSTPATVTVALSLTQGQAAPLVVRVAPQSASVLNADAQTRIPAGAPYGITFSTSSSSNRSAPGIVVARIASSNGSSTPAVGVSSGQAGGISRWLVPPVPPGQSPAGLAVIDLARRPVRVSVKGFRPNGGAVPLPGANAVRLLPGAVYALSPSPATPVGWSPVEVEADGPVAVQLDPSPDSPPGTAPVVAWPLLAALG
ncbi:MAG TPA: hypothetical protein DCQ30_01815 [Acidimicrobiaceae bacterium]|nr:hypothetical protein [Acidimicrobiaceae bacterium]